MAGKVYIKTFGCQMNEYDSAKMADVLAASEGLQRTLDPEQAEVILFTPAPCARRHKRRCSPISGA